MTIPPLLPILDAGLAGDRILELVELVAEGGARWVEYRDKVGDDRGRYERCARLAEACRRLDLDLLVNDRVDVALAVGAEGVHLGQRDLPVAVARRLMGADAVVGLSVDTAAEAKAAADLEVDYVALGPVFATATKPDAGPVVGVEGVRATRQALGDATALVVIGGITPENATAATAAGGDCVAVISSIVGARDPAAATADLLVAAREGLTHRRAGDDGDADGGSLGGSGSRFGTDSATGPGTDGDSGR